MNTYIRRWQVISTVAIVVLAVTATLLGLFREGFYKDPYSLLVQASGQDMVTLAVIVPLLVVSMWFGLQGSLRGYFVWLGSLGYILYTYAVYAVITEFNPFFLGYVALFSLSLYTFVAGLLQTDAKEVKSRLENDLPVKLMSGFFLVMGVLVAVLWLSEVIPSTITNTKPESVADVGLPANVVHVLDLGVLIPAMFISAWWLWQKRAWGYVLPGVFFVKLASIGLAVLGMIVWMSINGEPVELVEIIVFSAITLANIIFAVKYLYSIQVPTTENEETLVVAPGD